MARSIGQHGETLTQFLTSLTVVIIGKKASQSLETLHFAMRGESGGTSVVQTDRQQRARLISNKQDG